MPAHARALRMPPAGVRPAGSIAAALDRPSSNLLLWYLGLIPYWTGVAPRLRGRLLLRTHEWIVDRILGPGTTVATALADLGPDGALERALTALVPPAETERWRRFIRAVVARLRHALLRPVTRRNEAWLRWLFLIPYGARESWPGARERAG